MCYRGHNYEGEQEVCAIGDTIMRVIMNKRHVL